MSVISATNVTTVLIFLCTFCLVLSARGRRRRLPPGPPHVPVLGSVLSLIGPDILTTLRQLHQKHGDIYSFYIGQQLTIVLNGYQTIHNGLVKKGGVFSNRPQTRFPKEFLNHGIVFGASHLWKHNRQFTQKALQEFGFSKHAVSMEDRIHREIEALISEIEKRQGQIDAEDIINKSLANVVSGVVFGKRFDFEDPAFHDLMKGVQDAAKCFAMANVLLEAFPWMRYFPGDMLKLRFIKDLQERSGNFYSKSLESHKREHVDGSIRDLVDSYIKAMGESGGNKYTPRELRGIQGDIVGAGSETSAATIRWLLLYLLNNPDVQCKLHQEIDNVIGKDRKPRLTDRPNLPYVEAAICETLRLSSPAPLAIPHTVDHDMEFEGYLFPANTNILINLDSVLKDPNVWQEPEVFHPERFIDETGQLLTPTEFIPFSVGRRACIGESVARMELFLYVTSLLQRFEFLTLEGTAPPKTLGKLGLTYCPLPYKMHIVNRI